MAACTRSSSAAKFTVPGMTTHDGTEVAGILQDRLNALNDLALTLKHVHWNVVGPHFIAVHEMLDPQVEAVRAMVDETAERIATLGVAPVGTPAALAARSWDDYDIDRAGAIDHLGALDVVYRGVIESQQFHWFVRAHLETSEGALSSAGETREKPAATSAGAAARRR